MRYLPQLILSMFVLVTSGCNQQQDARVPESTIVKTDAKTLFYQRAPECSSGDHYLKLPGDSADYVWLFGAYNNGRREENVLITRTSDSVRLQAWWLNRAGKMWCMDTFLSNSEFDTLLKTIDSNNVFELPNMDPLVSHAMTYWVKIKIGDKQHEACAYYVDRVQDTQVFDNPSDKDHAINWSHVVSELLRTRRLRFSAVRPATFDKDENVVWDLPADSSFDKSEIFER